MDGIGAAVPESGSVSGATVRFRLFRFFMIASAITFLAIAATHVAMRVHDEKKAMRLAEHQNLSLAQSLANALWWPSVSSILSKSNPDGESLQGRSELRQLHDKVEKLCAELPAVKVKIFNAFGTTVYSSDLSEIGDVETESDAFSFAIREGKPKSRLIFREDHRSSGAASPAQKFVESYLPIHNEQGELEGVFEIYTDISPFLGGTHDSAIGHLDEFLWLCVAIYAVLLPIVWCADRTIKHQYAEICEKNAALQRENAERWRAEEALRNAQGELERRVEDRTRDLRQEIEERKRAEREARHHRRKLAQMRAAVVVGEMATHLAHELNQPLTVISGCTQACLRDVGTENRRNKRLRDWLEQVASQAERANQIVRRVRNFMQDGGHIRVPIDVNDAIKSVSDLLDFVAREHDAGIAYELADDLPAVVADPIQIQQVVLNIANNGMEAMDGIDPHRRRLTIRTLEREQGMIEVAIEDVGCGVEREALSHIFDPFFTDKRGGLGMGLAISNTIIEAHGGRLWARSDGASGATFRFTLPVADHSHHVHA